MKTLLSLALAGLVSISTLIPTMTVQEPDLPSVPASSTVSEAASCVLPESDSCASSDADAPSSVEDPAQHIIPAGTDAISSNSLPSESGVSENNAPDEESPAAESQPDSTVGDLSDAFEAEEINDVLSDTVEVQTKSTEFTAAPADDSAIQVVEVEPEETASQNLEDSALEDSPVMLSEAYAVLLASNQADSMMGSAGMVRDNACTQVAASFALADYPADTEDEAYILLWEALNSVIEQLAASGYASARCSYADSAISLLV